MNILKIWEIFVFSLIQGITEFFPISSSGHLVIVQKLLNIKEPQILLNTVLHLGSLCAIVFYFKKEIKELLIGFKEFFYSPGGNFKSPQMKFILQIFIAIIPTALIGYFFSSPLEKAFNSLKTVSIFLFFNGLFLLLTKFSKEKRETSLIIHPFLIGIFQGIAIIPGFSRSGLTIGIALFLGWKREKAAKFSFLLFIPTIFAAFLFELNKTKVILIDLPFLLLGFLLTTIISFIFLKSLIHIIRKGSFYFFSFYCLFIGLIAFVLSFIMK